MRLIRYGYAYRALVLKQVRRFLRAWVQNLLPSVVTALLFLVVFGQLIGRELGDMAGVPYADYILPGLVALAVATNAYNNVTLAFYGARLQRHIEELLVAPLPAWLIIAGYVSAGVLRGLIAGGLVLLVALPLTGLQLHHPGTTLAIALLTALLFACAGLINGLFARSFEHTSVVATFVLTPLIYLGGLFYPIARLPEAWQTVAAANPMVYIIDGFRHGLLGLDGLAPGMTLAVLAGAATATALVAWALVVKGVRIRS